MSQADRTPALSPEVRTVARQYTVRQAAEQLGCGRDYVYALVRTGRLRAREFPTMTGHGKPTIRISATDLTEFIDNLPEA